MSAPHVEITKRTVYPPMGVGRKRVVYDAKHGSFDATGATAKEARALLLRDMAYCEQHRSERFVRDNCALEPAGFEQWCFQLRTDEPWRSGSYLFRAATAADAYARIASDYADHPDCQTFLQD